MGKLRLGSVSGAAKERLIEVGEELIVVEPLEKAVSRQGSWLVFDDSQLFGDVGHARPARSRVTGEHLRNDERELPMIGLPRTDTGQRIVEEGLLVSHDRVGIIDGDRQLA